MNSRNLHPRDGFLVTNANYFSELSQQVLTDLYLPIIGTDANSLYLYLWQLTTQKLVSIDRYQHTRIINATGESIGQIESALTKLEGIGLVRTFLRKDIIGSLFLYELSAPVSPEKFFEDDLLSSYLNEILGEKNVLELQEKYTLHPANVQKFKEITTPFFTAYKFAKTRLNQEKPELNYQPARSPINFQFDQNLFLTLMAKNGVSQQLTERNLRQFSEFCMFYNINELELANALITSGSIKNDQFLPDRLTDYLNLRLASHGVKKAEKTTVSTEKLSGEEQKLIQKSINLSPYEFIKQVKDKFGGYPSNSEIAIVRKLIQRQKLPNEVINILIYYEINRYTSLSQKVTDVVANDWLKDGIQSAEEALVHIKNFKHDQQKKTSYTRRKSSKPVPKWFNEDSNQTTSKDQVSKENLSELIRQEEEKRRKLEGQK
ncbi:DnaD domain protein [Xylocopilactobacillus apicola]|uniref:Helicase DnaB n=1 Tax=Xylocopilactobacillus apicola TaxID=2932184 RepID=A0AAU9D864_9LACO|nr:DnaD domain protein [Xylocopilactobacillus apicola]BDR58520.1 helicase DnaB [Xylocopilactobacillus apicola]